MIVVDASVLVNALGDGSAAGEAARAALFGEGLAAPDLVDLETISVMRKHWLGNELTDEEFADGVDALWQLEMARYPALPLLPRTFELRHTMTPYDAAFVALAELLECPLVTSDGRLANAPGPQCEFRLVTSAG